jgi:subtilisin family serine protease
LGAPWQIGDKAFGVAYERAAKRALSSGSLLVVAAGNEFGNPRFVGAVGTPGNSPSALTVAAIARDMRTAEFSCRKVPQAPEVKGPDIAGPGVDVYSSWPVSLGQTNTISGTSMATPHVAGIAALLAESNSKLRGQALKDELLKTCKSLDSSQKRRGEVGSGIAQAPV